jgi:hypothetical protein
MEEARNKVLAKLGNMVDPEVPISQDEDADNAVCRLFPMPEGIYGFGCVYLASLGQWDFLNLTSQRSLAVISELTGSCTLRKSTHERTFTVCRCSQ